MSVGDSAHVVSRKMLPDHPLGFHAIHKILCADEVSNHSGLMTSEPLIVDAGPQALVSRRRTSHCRKSEAALPLCERVLKRGPAPQERALLWTLNGSEVGDLFMSLIHTCQSERRELLRVSD